MDYSLFSPHFKDIISCFQFKINAFRQMGEKLPILLSFLSYFFTGKVARGDLEKSEELKEKSEENKNKKPHMRLFFLVAGEGFEPTTSGL